MSFRQIGGLNYAAKNNIVSNNYNSSNNLLVTQNVGLSNSYINFLSDISGNIDIDGNVDISGNLSAYYMFLSSGSNYSNLANAVMPKSYIDLTTNGIKFAGDVDAISTLDSSNNTTTYPVPINTNLTVPFYVDGYQITVNNKYVLLNDQVNQVNNGVYEYTSVGSGNYQFQRSTLILPVGYNAQAAFIIVNYGVNFKKTGWL